MVYNKVGENLPEVWKPKNEGDFIEGIYAQKKENVGKNNANLYLLEVEGEMKSIWGSTVLDDKMVYVKIGDKIKITYDGEEKNYKKFIVERDEDETSEEQPVE